MMNLILANQDPRRFGVAFCPDSYPRMLQLLLRTHSSNALCIIWKEISDRARQLVDSGEFFVLADREAETPFIRRIAAGEIDQALERNQSALRDRVARWRFIARHRYPLMHSHSANSATWRLASLARLLHTGDLPLCSLSTN